MRSGPPVTFPTWDQSTERMRDFPGVDGWRSADQTRTISAPMPTARNAPKH